MQTQSNLKAAFWMACSLGCMLIMTWAGRETTRELDVFQVMEMRSLIGLLMLYPLIRLAGGFRAMAAKRPLQHVGRNVAHYAGQFLWLMALTMIPLAQLIAIEFTTPIWTALLAVSFLGERMTPPKTIAIALGLIGVLVIVRPGVASFDAGQMIVLAAAVAFGVSMTMTKSLTRTESAVRIIFWMLVIQSLIGLVPAVLVWKTPSASLWPWILLIAFGGSYAHYCMAQALSNADATVVTPMDFLRVPATAALGYFVYSEKVDLFTVLGTVLILSGNLLNLAVRRKAAEPVEVP
ncbi:DMT family transporter [Mesorhizobium sp. LHD-90]|uniref:DMT family transporter n=1 Tax=Mesorhizobium sp. LHD-90 TaxID=3071414 RepID=UPI0027E07D5D|nr:DMT family transporter [Mesorhizobium sp. LHD-90]MDQ6434310.1 DMT family transporter [Mesorhizobium sp. LHD-90]